MLELGAGVQPVLWRADLTHLEDRLYVGEGHGGVAGKETLPGSQALVH
jgi:hypothetical protein